MVRMTKQHRFGILFGVVLAFSGGLGTSWADDTVPQTTVPKTTAPKATTPGTSTPAKTDQPQAVEAQAVRLSGTPLALTAGPDAGSLLVATDTPSLVWLDATGAVRRSLKTPDLVARSLQSDPTGAWIAIRTGTGLSLLESATGAIRWTSPKTKAALVAYRIVGSDLLLVYEDGTLTSRALTSAAADETKIRSKERRRVVKASIAPDGRTVVLGVADG